MRFPENTQEKNEAVLEVLYTRALILVSCYFSTLVWKYFCMSGILLLCPGTSPVNVNCAGILGSQLATDVIQMAVKTPQPLLLPLPCLSYLSINTQLSPDSQECPHFRCQAESGGPLAICTTEWLDHQSGIDIISSQVWWFIEQVMELRIDHQVSSLLQSIDRLHGKYGLEGGQKGQKEGSFWPYIGKTLFTARSIWPPMCMDAKMPTEDGIPPVCYRGWNYYHTVSIFLPFQSISAWPQGELGNVVL